MARERTAGGVTRSSCSSTMASAAREWGPTRSGGAGLRAVPAGVPEGELDLGGGSRRGGGARGGGRGVGRGDRAVPPRVAGVGRGRTTDGDHAGDQQAGEDLRHSPLLVHAVPRDSWGLRGRPL